MHFRAGASGGQGPAVEAAQPQPAAAHQGQAQISAAGCGEDPAWAFQRGEWRGEERR